MTRPQPGAVQEVTARPQDCPQARVGGWRVLETLVSLSGVPGERETSARLGVQATGAALGGPFAARWWQGGLQGPPQPSGTEGLWEEVLRQATLVMTYPAEGHYFLLTWQLAIPSQCSSKPTGHHPGCRAGTSGSHPEPGPSHPRAAEHTSAQGKRSLSHPPTRPWHLGL